MITTYYIDETATTHDLIWLSYSLSSLGLNELNKATGVPGLNRNDAYEKRLFVPRLDEQQRIAAILDQADALRRKRRQALDRLQNMNQAFFTEMFGDVDQSNNKWPVKQLQHVVRADTIITYGIVQAGKEFPGGIPYIRTGDIVNGRIQARGLRRTDPSIAAKFARSRVETGEIVMSIRATVGTTALVEPEFDGANLTQGTARISPGPNTNAVFLLYFLRSRATQRWIAQQVKGATFREITLSRLRELPVVIPPRRLQEAFANKAAAVAKMEADFEFQLTKFESLFASLQHRAFRGEL